MIATGEAHSVREFLDEAFGHAGLDWRTRADRRAVLSPGRGRLAHRRLLEGEGELGWEPTVRFTEPVRKTVDADRERELESTTRELASRRREARPRSRAHGGRGHRRARRSRAETSSTSRILEHEGYDACAFPRDGEPCSSASKRRPKMLLACLDVGSATSAALTRPIPVRFRRVRSTRRSTRAAVLARRSRALARDAGVRLVWSAADAVHEGMVRRVPGRGRRSALLEWRA